MQTEQSDGYSNTVKARELDFRIVTIAKSVELRKLSGRCHLHESMIPHCLISFDVIIGAGSVVKERFKIPKGKIAVGNPARIVTAIHEEVKQKVLDGVKHYQELSERYKNGLKIIE